MRNFGRNYEKLVAVGHYFVFGPGPYGGGGVQSSIVNCRSSIAWAFTWEGELDPNEFDSWKVVKVTPTPQGLIWVYIRNPDQESPIKIVAQLVSLDFILIGYRYFKNGEPYMYTLDPELDKYMPMELSEERRRMCMQCHQKEGNAGQKAI